VRIYAYLFWGRSRQGPLGKYLRDTFEGERDDGFIQRFQLNVYPDLPRTWRNVDRYPDTDARQLAFNFFESLDLLDPERAGRIPSLRLGKYVRFRLSDVEPALAERSR
jgi:hypothetical protein